MAAGIFGEAVDDELGALPDRLLPQRAEEGVVDRDRRLLLAGESGVARGAHGFDIDQRIGRVRRAFEIDERDLAALFVGERSWRVQESSSISSRVAPAGKSRKLTPKRDRMRAISVSVAA
jgi:hypothetical protein